MASGRSWEAVPARRAEWTPSRGIAARRGADGAAEEPGHAPPARAGALRAVSCQEPSGWRAAGSDVCAGTR